MSEVVSGNVATRSAVHYGSKSLGRKMPSGASSDSSASGGSDDGGGDGRRAAHRRSHSSLRASASGA